MCSVKSHYYPKHETQGFILTPNQVAPPWPGDFHLAWTKNPKQLNREEDWAPRRERAGYPGKGPAQKDGEAQFRLRPSRGRPSILEAGGGPVWIG